MQKSTPLWDFIVHIPKPYENTISYKSLTLEVVTKFNQHNYRSRTAIVDQIPLNCKYPIKKGDILYIDYMVIEDQSEQYILDRKENIYKVPYSPEHGSLNNFAYAYQNESGIHMINDWCFIEPLKIEAKEEITAAGIILPEIVHEDEDRIRKADMGILRYVNPEILEGLDVKIGDTIQYHPYSGWDTKIGDKDMTMAQIEDVLMVVENFV